MEIALAVFEKYLETKSQKALIKFWQLYPRPIPSWHIHMMNDESRNTFYQSEIQSRCKNKVVLDLGCGTGLLTQYALEAGAKHIYGLEQDPILQKCYEFSFKKEITEGRITLISKRSQDLVTEDFANGLPEIIIHEIFGKSLFEEKVMEIFTDLFKRKVVVPSMDFLPQKFSLWGRLHGQELASNIKDPKYSEKFWYLEDISYFGSPILNPSSQSPEFFDVSSEFEIFSIDLKHFEEKLETEHTITAKADGNLIRVWFDLYGENSTLSTNALINKKSHWGSPKYMLRFKEGEVSLKTTYANEKFLSYLI